QFQPAETWTLRLLVQRSIGALDKAFTSFGLDYRLPDAYATTVAPPAPAPAEAQAPTPAQAPTQPPTQAPTQAPAPGAPAAGQGAVEAPAVVADDASTVVAFGEDETPLW